MTTLSTHVLDTERGIPAVGVPVTLFSSDEVFARGVTDGAGRIADMSGGSLSSGVYRLEFDIGAYWTSQGRAAPFLQRITLEFAIDASMPHYHVPLLMSAYACTSYRGS